MNRRCHLYSAGRPSRWALAHISRFTVCLSFFCFFCIRLQISQRGKSQGREILHACWPTTRTSLFPFWRSEVKCQGHQGHKTRLALRSPTRLAYEWYMRSLQAPGGRAHFLAAEGRRRAAMRVGIRNYAELGVAASTKAVWWDLRLASLLTHLLVHGQVTIIFVVSVCLSVQSFSQQSSIRFGPN